MSLQNTVKKTPSNRYFVPDFSPIDRKPFEKMIPKFIFVAESPHINEVEAEDLEFRRPLCGAAGRQWWGLLSELLEGDTNTDVSLPRIQQFCLKHQIVVMNAVQYPLDPKVARLFPKADPVSNLGFNKVAGAFSFKKLKATDPVQSRIAALRKRLTSPANSQARIYCLGNDAEWFVSQALTEEEKVFRLGEKIPHPSAWWRRGGEFGRIARAKLEQIFDI